MTPEIITIDTKCSKCVRTHYGLKSQNKISTNDKDSSTLTCVRYMNLLIS